MGFYGLSYWYPFQVTALGLGPIWMSANEDAKRKAAAGLRPAKCSPSACPNRPTAPTSIRPT